MLSLIKGNSASVDSPRFILPRGSKLTLRIVIADDDDSAATTVKCWEIEMAMAKKMT